MLSSYYNTISPTYEELHRSEQEKKLALIKQHIVVKHHDLLLDVGCGTGITSQFDCRVVGVDPAIRLLERCPLPLRVQGEAEHLPFKNNVFDIVVSVTAIQNFHDIEQGFREIKRVGKRLFVLTFLKKSAKKERIINLIKKYFAVLKEIEEEKDLIFFCHGKDL